LKVVHPKGAIGTLTFAELITTSATIKSPALVPEGTPIVRLRAGDAVLVAVLTKVI
jgi:hypothetical protein